MVSPAVRPDDIRRHNLSLLLTHVHHYGALTRAELTARLGLSRSTIGALVAELAELDLVEESVPSGGTRAGRPSHMVGPHPHGPFVVAVDVEVTHLTVAAVGLGGDVLGRRVVELSPAEAAEPACVARRVIEAVPALTRATGLTGRLVCIGVSVPGTVDRSNGTIGIAPNLGWRDTAFGSMLARLVGRLPVIVGNDADLAVLAEHIRGRGRGCDDLVFLIGRAGVGAGIMVNGVALRGHDGHAGEIGHTVVDANGPVCHCGKRGCLETYVGDQALLALARRDGGDAGAVFAAVRDGDAVARAAVTQAALSLGRAIAGLVNTLNPERVLLGGSFADMLDLARRDVEAALRRYVLDAPGETVQLTTPELGADSSLLGAAEMAFARLLADPLAAAQGGRV